MLVLKLCTIAEVLDVFLDQCLRPAHPNPDMLETAYFFLHEPAADEWADWQVSCRRKVDSYIETVRF